MGSIGTAKQTPTNARTIENMNEAQIDREISIAERMVKSAEKTMAKNDIVNTAEARAMRNAFPLGVGGSGWSQQRLNAKYRQMDSDAKKANAYVEAQKNKEAAETRIENLKKAKNQIAGTGKTLSQIKEETVKKTVTSTPKTLKWETKQKGGFNKDGSYSSRIIQAGNMQIRGSEGYYTIWKDGKQIGTTDKLSKAKAYAERKK